jgi:putative membrane-bound dehydrogenase-like protein
MRISHFVLALQLLCISASTAQTFPAANGLERSLVAEQPLLKNPVSVSVDVDGTIYVTETARRKMADLDIRDYYKHGWVPEDVSHTSIEDKLAFFRERLDGTNKLVEDQNKDGVSDIKDLTVLSEKIIRLTDTDGDGIMDESNVFAEGFNTEVTGIAAGTLAWRGDVYATIAPDVWKLRDTDGDGKADQRESLAHGFGVHIAYAGHDMHGLTHGPDGRLYWSIGDKGTNVTSKEGENWFAPHEGAVLRCYPDGSGFEIFARGLRNPQEIAFDKYGNLFSVDNDSDQKGERERFLHITEGSDTGWRNYYQYRGSSYNPWMAENIWEPEGEFQPAYITPTNGNYSDGPAGFAYNPGTALNAKYEDAFFVTEFPKGNLRSFKVKPKGATFEMTDEHTVYSGPMNVGISFGPDGALYSADWSGGYALNEKGAVWKLDDPTIAGTAIRKEVAAMLLNGPSEVSTTDLVKRLSHPDMRIRLDAQWELAKRKATAELHQVIVSSESKQLAIIHATWALSQHGQFFEKAFHHLANSKDPILRAQAAKHAGETLQGTNPLVTKMLADDDAQVRFQASTAIWKMGDSTAINAVIIMLAENDDEDAYLRHAGVLALTASPAEEIAAKTLSHESTAVRLAAAVAFRRLSSPLAAKLLSDSDPRVVAEAAHAIYDDPAIVEAYPALADLLKKTQGATPPAIRRSIASNRRLGDAASAKRLTEYALQSDAPTHLRIAALEALASWNQSFGTDPVDGRHNPFEPADEIAARTAFSAAAVILQSSPDKAIATSAAAAAKELEIVANDDSLAAQAIDTSLDARARIRALEALAPKRSGLFKKTAAKLLEDKIAAVRTGTAEILHESDPAAVLGWADMAIMKSEQIEEQQQAILILAKIGSPAAKAILTKYSKRFTEKGKTRDYLLLEFSEALPGVSETIPPYSASLTGGDPALGEKVFNEHLAAQCTACHRIGDEGSEVGPPLTEVGKKGREYILESLVYPQAKITSGYGMMAIQTKKGISIVGSLIEENKQTLTLILLDKTQTTVNIDDIATRTKPLSTMPPMGEILSSRELRDLVAYLDDLK